MSAIQGKIPVLHAARLFAALFVMMVHYEVMFGQTIFYGTMATTALSWFFVLSGFILSYTYPTLKGVSQYKRFYVHRVVRIFPVYWLAVIVAALFVSINYLSLGDAFFASVNRPFELRYDLPDTLDASFWTMATLRHLTFTQSVGSIETLNLVFNGPLWSLVLEMYFYLCFPLLLILLRSINTKMRVGIALVGLYLIQYLLIRMNLPDAQTYDLMNLNVPVYTNPFIRGFEFVFGMLLYKAYILYPYRTDVSDTRTRWPAAALSTLFYFGSITIAHNYLPYQYSMYYATVPAVCFSVFALSRMNWQMSSKGDRLCVLMGGLSYVLYAFHWTAMEIIKFYGLLPESLPFLLHFAVVIAVLLLLSYLIYAFLETPIRRTLYRYLDPAKRD